jgi:glutamine synthetase
MKANYKDKVNPSSEIALGNLYDMNKQMMEQEPELTQEQKIIKQEALTNWFYYEFEPEKYYMLLCHELRDYTLFNLDRTDAYKMPPLTHCEAAAADIIECMSNRGKLISIDLQENNTWELWIHNTEGCFAYYLFPYGEAVLEY